MKQVTYDQHISVDHDGFDNALVLTVWSETALGEIDRVIRVPVEHLTDFMAQVVQHSGYALRDAGRRLEVGHCETCGNTGLVDTVKHGRPWNEQCPDCRHRWPDKPFANAPHIGRREEVSSDARM